MWWGMCCRARPQLSDITPDKRRVNSPVRNQALIYAIGFTGEHIGALAMSEPGAGSDVVGMRCRADYKDGKFVLNGTKMWCTNGTVASTLVVYAKTQPDDGAHGITAFLIEKGMQV